MHRQPLVQNTKSEIYPNVYANMIKEASQIIRERTDFLINGDVITEQSSGKRLYPYLTQKQEATNELGI